MHMSGIQHIGHRDIAYIITRDADWNISTFRRDGREMSGKGKVVIKTSE